MKGLHKFFTRDSFDKIMFGHVTALVNNFPYTTESAIQNFISQYELSSDYSVDTLKTTYFRIKKEFTETTA